MKDSNNKNKKKEKEKRKNNNNKNHWKQPRRDLNLHPNFLQLKKRDLIPLGHATTAQYVILFLIALKYFSLSFTLFEPCGAVFIMNSKRHVRKNSLSISKQFRIISVFIHSRVLFRPLDEGTDLLQFFAAFAEVQVAVFRVLSLPRQGLAATCPIGDCCVCSLLLFASEILCDSPKKRG